MDKYISQLAALEWSKVLGIGAALAVLYYFLMFNDGSQIQQDIAAAQTRLQTSQAKLSQTEKALEDANRFEAEVQATQKQFERIIEFMPTTLSSTDLTNLVNKQAQLSGVRVANLRPNSELKRTDFYETARIGIELDGSFAQIVTFLSHLSRVPRLLTFEQTEIKPTSSAGAGVNPPNMLTFRGTLVGYRYIKEEPVTPNAAAGQNPPGAKP